MSSLYERLTRLSPNRLALLVLDLQAKLGAGKPSQPEPIAVIGLGCRFPGGVHGPAQFWDLLAEGRDAIEETPRSRWDADALFDPNPDAPGKVASRWGGFLTNVDRFDAEFFGMSPREARSLDPQQRLTLEVGWEALEHAGYAPDRLHGSATGVFLGICNGDYGRTLLSQEPELLDTYAATGNAYSVASGRLSYVLGLQGPSISVDTACSSSLVAVHLAVQGLRSGDCRMALAGGVNAILSPATTIALSRAHMMSSDGRCKAFDAAADGFVRSEGCGFVVLKRLADAESEGDTILAVIRGSATNQDGRSNGITAPNGPSQVAVIRQALADAGVEPSDVSYVEAHGTGTALGDPIEVQALGAAIGSGLPQDRPLLIGSVKTNLGHLESAAGIAGLIKVILSLQQGVLPRQLHFQTPSPHVDWDRLGISVVDRLTQWPNHPRGRRIAGVSSFGFSGTNAHIVVEAAPASDVRVNRVERPRHLVSLSARTQPALRTMAEQLHTFLERNPDVALADLAHTANAGRSDFDHRAAIVAASHAGVRDALAALHTGTPSDGLIVGHPSGNMPPDVAFLFTAQGAQYRDMGRRLYETQPTFRRALDLCATLLEPHLDRPLLSIIWTADEESMDAAAGLLDQTMYTQPALFAVQYALTELWRSWGIRPSAVLGHSAGELVAACVAGALSLEDGLRLVAERGHLMQTLTPPGAMASVRTDEQTVRRALAGIGGKVSVAAVNGLENVTIAGERGALRSALAVLQAQGLEVRELAISIASHSPLMDPMLDAFERAAASVTWQEPGIDVVSGMTGDMVREELGTPSYWRRHAREAVQFARALQTLRAQGYRHFVEIGPAPVLTGLGQQVFSGDFGVWLPSLRRGIDDWEQLLTSLGALYAEGVAVDWAGFDRDYELRKIALPTYPFQRERYWIETSAAPAERTQPASSRDEHPLLGGRLRSPAISGAVFERAMRADSPWFLADHRVFDAVILPSPAFVEMALAAGASEYGSTMLQLENFTIREPLILSDEAPRLVQTVLQQMPDGATACAVYSRDDGSDTWQLHTDVRISRAAGDLHSASVPPPTPLEEIQSRCQEEIDGPTYYERLAGLGLAFGPAFRGIQRIWRGEGEALADITLPESLEGEAGAYWLHPAVLDACLQAMGAAIPTTTTEDAYLLVSFDRLRVLGRPSRQLRSHIQLRPTTLAGGDAFIADAWLYDVGRGTVAIVEGLAIRRASRAALLHASSGAWKAWLHQLRWEPADAAAVDGALEPLATWLPSRERLDARLEEVATVASADGALAEFLAAMPRLEAVAVQYARQAIQALGQRRLPADDAPEMTAQALGVAPRHRRLFHRMLGWLRQDRHAPTSATMPAGSVDGHAEPGPAGDAARAVEADFPCVASEARLLIRCGERLADVLRGDVDPLHLLFPDGSSELVQPLYESSPSAQFSHRLLRACLETSLGGLPADRRLRVLEIGAGTGATTASLLSVLPVDRTEYVFTDISPTLLAQAEARFSEAPCVRFQRLDAERDPEPQGFAAESFDIIIAANVLHATEDLGRTLGHAKHLLAPGGLLLVLEATMPLHWVDLTFGLTEGWWKFADHDRRPDHPLLAPDRWLDTLADAGFVEALALPHGPSLGIGVGQTVLLAQRPPAENLPIAPATPKPHWTIFADDSGVGDTLAALIATRGESCRIVVRGAQYAELAPGRVQIDPSSKADYARALNATGLPAGQARRVVHLWSLDIAPGDHVDEQTRTSANDLGCASALLLTQALVQMAGTSTSSLWLVTREAQPLTVHDGEAIGLAVAQAPLWGFGRVIALEHPDIWGGLLDLSGKDSMQTSARAVYETLVLASDEDQIAIRGGRRLVARLTPDSVQAGQPLRWDAQASYLITGGPGGLGLKLAGWMADQGARHLVLQSRTGLPERSDWADLDPTSRAHAQVEAIRVIEARGASVTVVKGDVADRAHMVALFDRFGSDLPPLRGVIHAAAALDLSAVRDLTVDALSRMLRPKVTGAWLLHELTGALDLDFFVLFSSTASLLGVNGMAHYAAANEFLNVFAHYRRAQGYPALSVCWGTWEEMRATTAEQRSSYGSVGLRPMPTSAALSALGGLLSDPARCQATVASIDWSVLKPVYEARRRRPLLAHLTVDKRAAREAPASAVSTLLDRLVGAPESERRPLALAFVARTVGRVLRIDLTREIDPNRGLFDLGMDSLMAVELRARLEEAVGQPLPTSLTFNYPNISALTDVLLTKVAHLLPQADAGGSGEEMHAKDAETTSMHAETDPYDLSEHELAELLSARLARMP
ncbi:MAG: SDR family NAD(P)-dependent oxidoreductase [Chloroflexi bacterium]|nr:SDR family NAD(P)-dependent oxidoreductase [Chloroflexota bacterium]